MSSPDPRLTQIQARLEKLKPEDEEDYYPGMVDDLTFLLTALARLSTGRDEWKCKFEECPDCCHFDYAVKIRTELEQEVSRLRAALRLCLDWILLGNHEEAPGWIEARDAAQAALESRP